MGYTDTYYLGATNVTVGLSAAVLITSPIFSNGGFLKVKSGGTLAIIQSPGSSYHGSTAVANGYAITSEVPSWAGPARFYLAAASATCVASIVFSYSEGISNIP